MKHLKTLALAAVLVATNLAAPAPAHAARSSCTGVPNGATQVGNTNLYIYTNSDGNAASVWVHCGD